MTKNFRTQGKLSKAIARLQMIATEFFEKGRCYSWKLAVYNTAWWIGNYCSRLKRLQFWALKRMTAWSDLFIANNVSTLLKTSHPTVVIREQSKYKIWVFWWQGELGMPKLVKSCYRQLRANNNNVTLITQDNINEYVHIPDYIFDKVRTGKISFTHLSDILRVSLLAEYGGLWVDSTCWVTGSIPKEVYDMALITPSTKGLPDLPSWSNSRWCGWGMGTNVTHNPLFTFARDFFYEFYKSNDYVLFYLVIDYLYDYAYRNIPEVKKMIDAVPENNVRRNDFHFMLNKPYDEHEYKNLIEFDWLFKLSYKTPWKEKTEDGKLTFYGMLLNKNCNG